MIQPPYVSLDVAPGYLHRSSLPVSNLTYEKRKLDVGKFLHIVATALLRCWPDPRPFDQSFKPVHQFDKRGVPLI